MESLSPTFRFGPYELRSRTRELYKHGSKLKVRRQPLEILNMLLARAGDVVTREEFRQKLWSSETFVDFEHVPAKLDRAEQMLQRFSLPTTPHEVAQRHEFGFGQITLEIEIKLKPLSPKDMRKQMLGV